MADNTNRAFKDDGDTPKNNSANSDDGTRKDLGMGSSGLGQPPLPGYSVSQQPGYPAVQQPGYAAPPLHGYPAQNQHPVHIDIESGAVPKPPSYLALAILTCLCCCWPFGIVAIINANKVDEAYRRGDYEEAKERSQKAMKWSISAIVSGIVIIGFGAYRLYINIDAINNQNF